MLLKPTNYKYKPILNHTFYDFREQIFAWTEQGTLFGWNRKSFKRKLTEKMSHFVLQTGLRDTWP